MHQEEDNYIADSKDDFEGWEILAIEPYKLGVKRVYMRIIHPSGRGVFQTVFAKDEYVEGLQVHVRT